MRIPYFKNDPIVVLILGFFTCGLYLLYWNYKMAKVINTMLEREAVSEVAAIVGGCCFPLNLLFYYQIGQAMPEIGRRANLPDFEDKSTMFLILGFFFPMITAMIVQSDINRVYDAHNIR